MADLTPNQRRRLDKQLEAMGLLGYQNPTLTASQLNALIASADLSTDKPARTRQPSEVSSPPLPTTPDITPEPGNNTDAPPLPAPGPGAIFSVSDPFKTIVQTMSSFFSPEDQRVLSDLYGFEKPAAPIPGELRGPERNNYLSRSRAEQALTALQNINPDIQADAGPGFNFLINAIGILRDYGGTEGAMNRDNYLKFDYATKELMSKAGGGSLSPYADLVSMFAYPGFSAGPLMPVRGTSGNAVFGDANKKLFT